MTAERAAPIEGDSPAVTQAAPELPTVPLTLPLVGGSEPRPDLGLPADVAELFGISPDARRGSPEP